MAKAGRGRPSKPTHLKVLQGDRKDRINVSEPVPAPAGVPKPPAWLNGKAKAMWRRLAADMHRKGCLTPWDVDAFAVLCASYVSWREAQELVDRDGVLVDGYRGSKVKNPAAQVARDMWQTFCQAASRFGLTPSDRAGLSLSQEERDDAEALLS